MNLLPVTLISGEVMKKQLLRGLAVLCVLIPLLQTGPTPRAGRAAPQLDPTRYLPLVMGNSWPTAPERKVNLDFSPYLDGQDPNTGITLPEAQIRARLALIAPYTDWVRSFGCGSGLESIGRIGHELGLKTAAGAWIGRDSAANQQQINCLIAQAQAGHVDLAIVGSEALLRNDVPVNTLIGYLDQVRAALPASIPVTTADVYSVLLANPGLADHVDVIMPNIYPFWEGYPVEQGTAVLNYWYERLAQTFAPKPVYISETGWPSCGSFGGSSGSPANAAAYFNQVVSWAREKQVRLFYFAALDERWKTRDEGAQGACWGVFDKNGLLKPGMQPAFSVRDTPYSTVMPKTCGAEAVSFQFTTVPPLGSLANVKGQTCGVVHLDYNIVLFIYVNGSWWVKPYTANPYTPIGRDGSWEVDYTTGGIDQQATILRAYLLPRGVDAFGDLSGYPYIDAAR